SKYTAEKLISPCASESLLPVSVLSSQAQLDSPVADASSRSAPAMARRVVTRSSTGVADHRPKDRLATSKARRESSTVPWSTSPKAFPSIGLTASMRRRPWPSEKTSPPILAPLSDNWFTLPPQRVERDMEQGVEGRC